jgi:O-antigen/teichoic acid export membrane protein
MAAALIAVPWLMLRLGQERLGVLSLIWVVVGYFSFLDMGLGRAITVAVARLRAQHQPTREEEWAVLGSALAVLLTLSGGAMAVGAALLATGLLPLKLATPGLAAEVSEALGWTIPSLPLLLVTSALRGHFEGLAAFRAVNLMRIPTGILLVGLPCATAALTPDLRWASASMLLVRVGAVVWAWQWLARDAGLGTRELARQCVQAVSPGRLRALLGFGGWVTVSNVVGPVIVYMDRFLIGATLGAAAVAAYVIPFDVVSRLPILVSALAAVVLPEVSRLGAVAAVQGRDGLQQARDLVRRANTLSAVSVALIVALGVALAPWAMAVWLGPAFAAESARVAQVLLVAFGINALAQLPFVALQAVGKARAVASLHLLELLPYAALVVWMLRQWGLEGAAWAWLLRGTLDYAVLSHLWRRSARNAANLVVN